MAHAAAGSIVWQIESLFDGGTVAGLTDRQLLERFTAKRDAVGDAAFAALATRYGPLVFHVCRQLLADRRHAEDAFLAVFFVFAQKAHSIRDPDRLAPWLHGKMDTRRAGNRRHRIACSTIGRQHQQRRIACRAGFTINGYSGRRICNSARRRPRSLRGTDDEPRRSQRLLRTP
jgi:hypothetical protein